MGKYSGIVIKLEILRRYGQETATALEKLVQDESITTIFVPIEIDGNVVQAMEIGKNCRYPSEAVKTFMRNHVNEYASRIKYYVYREYQLQ